jgi:hypothetical protein
MPQGQRHQRSTVPSTICLKAFSTPDDTLQLYSAQRHEEMFVSGYYWSPPIMPTDAHCVPWLDMSLDGPYAGKPNHIAKLSSVKLADDMLASFMKFYTSLRTRLNSCGFNPHLLPILPQIRPDVDLTITPIIEESRPVIGIGNDPRICAHHISHIGNEPMTVLACKSCSWTLTKALPLMPIRP